MDIVSNCIKGTRSPPSPCGFSHFFAPQKLPPPRFFDFRKNRSIFSLFPIGISADCVAVIRELIALRLRGCGCRRLPRSEAQRGAPVWAGAWRPLSHQAGHASQARSAALAAAQRKKLAAIAAYACGLMCVFIIVSLCSSDPHDLGSRQLDYRYSARRAPHARANGGGADLPRHSERGEGAKRPLYCGGGERSEGTPKTGVFGSCCQKAIKGESTGVLSPFFLGYGVMCPLRQGQGKATPLDVLLHL